MRSMTGFGQGAAESEGARVTVTLRGVNHRYLDLVIRLRDEARACETAVRELLTSELHRGRVEMSIEIEPLGGGTVDVAVDHSLIEALDTARLELAERGLAGGEMTFADILRLPDAIRLQAGEAQWSEAESEALLDAVRHALAQLIESRETEGAKLHDALVPRLDKLAEGAAGLAARREAVATEIAAGLRQRVEELAGESLEPGRLAQEVAYLVDRSDVAEELDRLGSHLEHFREVMVADGAIGKRLDFLTQEIFRELNTLGSKCRDAEMVQGVLDGKVLCEQLREQVQNVE